MRHEVSKMEHLPKSVNGMKLLRFFAKWSMLDVYNFPKFDFIFFL